MVLQPKKIKLIEDIWQHIEPNIDGHIRALKICIEVMTLEQLNTLSASLVGRYTMTQLEFDCVIGEVRAILRRAGQHFSETEYADFVTDVVTRLEQEIPN